MRVKPTLLDRAISTISPSWGYKRLQYRSAMALFDGASHGRRTKHWRAPGTSIQADTRKGLAVLRNRSRDLGQNNAYAAAAHREIPANIVGEGITPHIDLPTPAERERGERLVKEWFDSVACDFGNQMNFYGIENLVARTVVESGECLVRRVTRPSAMSAIPLQLQVLEPDYIDTSKDGLMAGNNRIIQGVEYNAQWQRVAYWLYDHHPGDQHFTMTDIRSSRVPADEILHIYRVERAGQVRGIPWSAPVLLRMRDFDEYEDAQLMQQKIAACFSAFILPGDQFGQAAGISETDEEKLLPEKMEPGMIEVLSDGKDVKFAQPPSTSGYAEYSLVTLHEIATGYGVPYSILTGDLRQVNFSSGRMGDRAFNRNLKHWQKNVFIPQLCQPVWQWFMEAVTAERLLPEPVPARWSPPRRELTDPAREIPALRDAARSGQMTMPEMIRQNGFDPDDFLREIQEWNSAMDRAGVVLDSDPRKVSGAGLTQARPGDSSLPPTSTEDNPDGE